MILMIKSIINSLTNDSTYNQYFDPNKKLSYVMISTGGYKQYEKGRIVFVILQDKIPSIIVKFYKAPNGLIQDQFKKQEINIYNKGKFFRDFIYIDDVINAFQIVSENLKGFNIYNVGSEKSYSIKEICNILKKLNGKKIRIITDKTKLRKNDVKNVVSNCSRIKKLGWKSNVSINEGLELTLNWYITKK